MSGDLSPALQRIIDFVNTWEVDGDVEHLTDAQQLQAWLAAHGLVGDTALTQADVRRAREIREALRTVLTSHHDDDHDADLDAANAVLSSVPLRIGFTDDGHVALDAPGDGIDAALGRLLAPIPAAAGDGSWERTKICPSDSCRWAFFDQSRNRSRRWCSMEVCGNREKGRAFRTRHSPGD